jgi:hypothetical protein
MYTYIGDGKKARAVLDGKTVPCSIAGTTEWLLSRNLNVYLNTEWSTISKETAYKK